MSKIYQLIIIGAGPAGIAAGIYAKRYGLNFAVIGPVPGGAIQEAHLVENYPGIKSISGTDLAKKFQGHLVIKPINEQVKKIASQKSKTGLTLKISTDKKTYQAQSIILATGMKIRKLNIKNEDKFLNKGISYYVSNNLADFKNKVIAVVGGGDSALTTAFKISSQAKKVYLIHRRDEFRGAPSLVKRIEKQKNIEIIYSAQVTKTEGKNKLEKIILNDGKKFKVNQLLIEIGGVPNIHLCKDLKIKMGNNFIITDKNQATNAPGIFAAGDITDNPLKQIVTAAAEGAIAAMSVYKYLKDVKC